MPCVKRHTKHFILILFGSPHRSIPTDAQYLKVVYSAEYPVFPADLAGRSFSRVLGTSQSCLELFLVELVRQPDAQFTSALNPIGYFIQFGEWGVTMGQLLSIPMMLIGLLLIIRSKPVSA